MVAEYAYVVAEGVHDFFFGLSSADIEKESALHHVAGIDQHYVVAHRAHRVYDCLAPGRAAEVVGIGQELGMCVVGCQQHEVLGSGCHQRCQSQKADRKSGYVDMHGNRL